MLSADLFACNVCDAIFGIKEAFESHMKYKHVTKKKRFSCNLCDYSTDHKSNLKRHQLTHTEKKDFVCSQCKKSFYLWRSVLYAYFFWLVHHRQNQLCTHRNVTCIAFFIMNSSKSCNNNMPRYMMIRAGILNIFGFHHAYMYLLTLIIL